MRGLRTSAIISVALLGLSNCVTEVCGCSPLYVPAIVLGRVLREDQSAVPGARVHAFSSAGANCHSAEDNFGFVTTAKDGSFNIGLSSYQVQDSVCIFVFAHPPFAVVDLQDSDTTLVVMNFRGPPELDSAQVELVLRDKQ